MNHMGCWEVVFNENFFQSHDLTGLVSLKNNFKISLKNSDFMGQNSSLQAIFFVKNRQQSPHGAPISCS